MFFKNLCVLVLWTKVAAALEGLRERENLTYAPGCDPAPVLRVDDPVVVFEGMHCLEHRTHSPDVGVDLSVSDKVCG